MEGLRHHGKAEDGHGEPHQIAQDQTGGERARPAGASTHHLRDQGSDAGARRRGRHKQRAGEQDEGGNIHDWHPRTNRAAT